MANHGFITSKKNFNAEQIRKDLDEINQRRFKGLLKIENSQWGTKGSWFISYKSDDQEHPHGFNIWITSLRKIEHRHTHGWAYYVEIVFSEELAAKYNGTISDEGISDKWKANPLKYPSYGAWLMVLYGHAKKINPKMFRSVYQMEWKLAPKELRDC